MPAAELHGYRGNAGNTTIQTSVGPSDNVLTLASLTIAGNWPDGSDGVFYAEIDFDTASAEKVKVTSRSTVTLSGVLRGQDGTVAVSHAVAAPIRHVFTADDARLSNLHAASPTQAALDHPNLLPPSTTVSTSAPGDAAAAGAGTNYSRGDHKHAREAATSTSYGSPTASAPGDVSGDGVAASVAHSDHKHAREGFGAPVASGVGDSAANGAAGTIAHSDHKHAREAFAGTGSAATVAHSDHNHASGAQTAKVSASQTTISTVFTDLSTAGPSVSVTIGSSQQLEITVGGSANSDGNAAAIMAFELSGANTRSANDDEAFSVNGTDNQRASRGTLLTGLNTGVTVVKAVYRSNNGANTATFAERTITGKPL